MTLLLPRHAVRCPLLGKIVFQQLLHRRKPAAQFAVFQRLRTVDQLPRQFIQLFCQLFIISRQPWCQRFAAQTTDKTRIAQTQYRIQADQRLCQRIYGRQV
ncbi:hypothetical protein D3C80_1573000 [compost metagenome]